MTTGETSTTDDMLPANPRKPNNNASPIPHCALPCVRPSFHQLGITDSERGHPEDY